MKQDNSLAIILGDPAGEERFRTTVLADNCDQAAEKAALLAERLSLEVELVTPAGSLPRAQAAPLADEAAEDEEPEREAGRAVWG